MEPSHPPAGAEHESDRVSGARAGGADGGADLLHDRAGRVRWGWRLLAFLFLAFGLFLFLVELSGWVAAPWTTGAWDTRWTVIPAAAALLLATWVMMEGVEKLPAAAAGIPLDGGTLPGFAGGAVVGVGLTGGVVLVAFFAGWVRWVPQGGSHGLPIALLNASAFFVVAALAEELLFRGYPFQVLAERFGGAAAVGLTAVTFGLLHGWNPGIDRLALANLVLAGVLLGLAYWRSYSLWFATGLHFGWNWALGFAADLPVSGLPLDTPGYDAVVRGPALWMGGAFGPEGGLLVTLAASAGIAGMLLGNHPRRNLRVRALRPLPDRHGEGRG